MLSYKVDGRILLLAVVASTVVLRSSSIFGTNTVSSFYQFGIGTDTKLTITYNDRHICFRIADAHSEQIALGERSNLLTA